MNQSLLLYDRRHINGPWPQKFNIYVLLRASWGTVVHKRLLRRQVATKPTGEDAVVSWRNRDEAIRECSVETKFGHVSDIGSDGNQERSFRENSTYSQSSLV